MTDSNAKLVDVTQEEYDSLQKQVNNLQSIVIEQQNTIREMRGTLVDVVREVCGWHEHTSSGIVFWNKDKMPPDYVRRLDEKMIQMVMRQQQAGRPPAEPQPDNGGS